MRNTAYRSLALALGALAIGALGWLAYDYFFATSDAPFAGEASAAVPDFVDRTADFGISVAHRQGDERLTALDETLGSGACALDYDNDGWMDLFIVNGTGDTRYYGRRHWWQEARGHRLLRNVNGRELADVTAQAGISAVSHGQGCVAADFDNDGHSDLFITNIGANLLLRNLGDGRFADATADSGLQGEGWHTAAAVADVDGDGRLDLYVGGFIDFEKGSRTYEPGSQFRQDIAPFFNSALYPALPNHLYRNKGGLQFEDVTAAAGVAASDGRTLAALWADVNEDRRPDLIVLNAAGTGSTTGYMNRGDWHFEPMGTPARIESGVIFHGIALGDLDNDGRADLVLTGAAGHQTALLFRENAEPQADPVFVDKARPWQLAREQYAALSPWSPGLADLNNDGWTDLFIVNGQILPDPDSPHVTVGQPKQLWLNDGHARLREHQPAPLSPLLDRQSARGLVVADFNNDGNVDFYVAHNNDLGQLLINDLRSPGHWLGVSLVDTDQAPDAVGARVRVTTELGGQTRWVTRGMGFLSDSEPRLHFGLGAAERAQIAVRWPDGSRNVYRHVPIDSYVTISRSQGLLPAPAAARGEPQAPGALAQDSPGIRTEYFSGLAAVADTPGIESLLREALEDPATEVRSAVVASLSAHPGGAALRLLVRFLEDPDDGVAAQAVDGVCGFEDEDTTRFLLRAFAHSAATVREHTADCFTRYNRDFQDQQAVIQRKDLAAPYLTALLGDADAAVRIAAARALGASEEFRGVAPLIELLDSAAVPLQAEAVRALGLIRDRSALPALVRLLSRPDVAPATFAQLFIALKRLDYSALDTALRDFAGGAGPYASVPAERRLATFLEILQAPDGVVLARARVYSLAATAYAGSARREEAAMLYARIAGTSGIDAAAAALTPLLRHASPGVRSAAYLAQFKLDPAGRNALLAAGLRDADAGVRISLLEQAARDNVVLPDTLLLDALRSEATGLAAAHALRQIRSEPVAQALLDWLLDNSARPELRIAALAAFGRARYALSLPDALFRTAPEDLRIAMLRFEAQRLPAIYVARVPPPFLARYLKVQSPALRQAVADFLLTREELWAKQEVLTLLQDRDAPELRHYVLSALPPGYFKDGAPLLKIAADPADPLRFEALRRLRGSEDEAIRQGLTAIARDEQENREARVLAAAALPEAARKAVLPKLLGG